jgi:hypothetical protein
VEAAVEVVQDVVPIIVGACVVRAVKAVVGGPVRAAWGVWVNKDVLRPESTGACIRCNLCLHLVSVGAGLVALPHRALGPTSSPIAEWQQEC